MFIRKVLAPTDLSANSKVGIAYAISAAREHQAELVILYVARLPVLGPVYFSETDLLFLTAMRRVRSSASVIEHGFWDGSMANAAGVDRALRAAELKLSHFAQTHFSNEIKGIQCKTRIGLGDVVGEIVASAAQEEADLIVMAKRERGPLSRLFSRSVSNAVSRRASCPVLSVCPPRISRPSREGQISRIATAMAGSKA